MHNSGPSILRASGKYHQPARSRLRVHGKHYQPLRRSLRTARRTHSSHSLLGCFQNPRKKVVKKNHPQKASKKKAAKGYQKSPEVCTLLTKLPSRKKCKIKNKKKLNLKKKKSFMAFMGSVDISSARAFSSFLSGEENPRAKWRPPQQSLRWPWRVYDF